MAEFVGSTSSKGRAHANLTLCFDSSQSLIDVKRTLRNGAGTIPFYDPGYLKSNYGLELFKDAPTMLAFFSSGIMSPDVDLSTFGETKIEHPFHVMDCGLCAYLALFVTGSLNYKVYQAKDFLKIHDNLRHHLTVKQTAEGEDPNKASPLPAYRYQRNGGHSFWVVNFVKGYSHAASSRYSAKYKPLDVFVPSAGPSTLIVPRDAVEPDYRAVSPVSIPVSVIVSAPPLTDKNDMAKPSKRAKPAEPSAPALELVEPPTPMSPASPDRTCAAVRTYKSMRSVLSDSDND